MHQFFDNDILKLLRKGVFPYEYMDGEQENKLKEKELPNIEYFHSTLSNEKCKQKDYDYVIMLNISLIIFNVKIWVFITIYML